MATPVHIITGSDEFLVHRRAEELYQEALAGLSDPDASEKLAGNCQTTSDVILTVNRFLDAIRTRSLFGSAKCVWLHSVNFLNETVTGKSAGTKETLPVLKEALEAILADTRDDIRVILSAAPVSRRNSLLQWAAKSKSVGFESIGTEGGAGGSPALQACLDSALKESSLKFSKATLEALIARVGGDARVALEEVRKLETYFGENGGKVTLRDLFDLVPAFGETDFFEVTEIFFSGPLPDLLSALRRHFFNNKESRPLLITLQNRVALCLQLRVLQDAGHYHGKAPDPGALDPFLDKVFTGLAGKSPYRIEAQNPFYLKRLAQIARTRTLKQWIDLQESLLNTFFETIHRPNQQEEVLRELAIRSHA